MVRPRTWWWIQISYLSLLLLAAIALMPFVPTVTEEDRLAALAVRLERVRQDGDWATVWDATTDEKRQELDANVISMLFGGGDLENGEPRRELRENAKAIGLQPESFRTMSPRARFLAMQKAYRVRYGPDSSGKTPLQFIESLLGFDASTDLHAGASINGNKATAKVMSRSQRVSGHPYGTGYWFLLVEGEWRLSEIGPGVSLQRKLAIFLSLLPEGQRETDMLVELGPGTPEETRLGLLTAVLRTRLEPPPDERSVLIDADPDHRLQEIISVVDAVFAAGAYPNLARSGESSLAPGIRVNGVPLIDIPLMNVLPPIDDHPALKRAFSVDPR